MNDNFMVVFFIVYLILTFGLIIFNVVENGNVYNDFVSKIKYKYGFKDCFSTSVSSGVCVYPNESYSTYQLKLDFWTGQTVNMYILGSKV
jgi:hypothetical protein